MPALFWKRKAGPKTFAWITLDGNFTGEPDPAPSDLAFYDEHGFYIFNGGSDYILRPEVLESNFYAGRVTGDEKYQQRALSAAQSMNKFLQVNNAFAASITYRRRIRASSTTRKVSSSRRS